jgi:hypothetical protein
MGIFRRNLQFSRSIYSDPPEIVIRKLASTELRK